MDFGWGWQTLAGGGTAGSEAENGRGSGFGVPDESVINPNEEPSLARQHRDGEGLCWYNGTYCMWVITKRERVALHNSQSAVLYFI